MRKAGIEREWVVFLEERWRTWSEEGGGKGRGCETWANWRAAFNGASGGSAGIE